MWVTQVQCHQETSESQGSQKKSKIRPEGTPSRGTAPALSFPFLHLLRLGPSGRAEANKPASQLDGE